MRQVYQWVAAVARMLPTAQFRPGQVKRDTLHRIIVEVDGRSQQYSVEEHPPYLVATELKQ